VDAATEITTKNGCHYDAEQAVIQKVLIKLNNLIVSKPGNFVHINNSIRGDESMFIFVDCIGRDDVVRRNFLNVAKIEAVAEQDGAAVISVDDGIFKTIDTFDELVAKINAAIAV